MKKTMTKFRGFFCKKIENQRNIHKERSWMRRDKCYTKEYKLLRKLKNKCRETGKVSNKIESNKNNK